MPTRLPVETPERARIALRAAAEGERRVLDALLYGRVAPAFALWGMVWAIGFVASGLGIGPIGTVWGVAVAVGWAGTALMIRFRRSEGRRSDATAYRYAASAATLSIHAALWALVLLSHRPGALGVYAGSVTGCAYAIAGIWRGRLLVTLGFGITALFLAGLALPPALFPFYAGGLGGGGLIAAALLLARLDPT